MYEDVHTNENIIVEEDETLSLCSNFEETPSQVENLTNPLLNSCCQEGCQRSSDISLNFTLMVPQICEECQFTCNSIQTTKADENSVVSGESSNENPFLIESCPDQVKHSHPLSDHYGNNTSENEYSFLTNAQNIRGSSYDEVITIRASFFSCLPKNVDA